jgi:hypothetical protein
MAEYLNFPHKNAVASTMLQDMQLIWKNRNTLYLSGEIENIRHINGSGLKAYHTKVINSRMEIHRN